MTADEIPTVEDGFDNHPVIETAVRAIRALAPADAITPLGRGHARELLKRWPRAKTLTARERRAILRRFPPIAGAVSVGPGRWWSQ